MSPSGPTLLLERHSLASIKRKKALTARSPAARLLESRVETRRGRVGDATETNM
eukprot:COSAG06_NODE_73241_length_160_cov_222.655738_1_plen_53_part_11